MTRGDCDVVVLAGDRGPGDPLAVEAGVVGKTLVPIDGKPMLARVLDAVSAASNIGCVSVVCPGDSAYAALLAEHAVDRRVDPGPGPAASAARALEQLDGVRPVLIVTGDHPLLRPGWLDAFVDEAGRSGADAAFGIVDHSRLRRSFPGHRRTHYRFRDIDVCGTNLFYAAGGRGRHIARLWQRFEADRKKPWRIVARLGLLNLLRYAARRLTLDEATAALSARMGASIVAVRIDDPEAAVDVDSPADLAFVQRLVADRTGTRA